MKLRNPHTRYYLQDIPPHKTELHLYSDNCGGQNKNHCLLRFLLALNDTGHFRRMEHYYPVTGYSFLPCDSNFGDIKESLQKHDRIYVLSELTEIIVSSAKPQKFVVKKVKTSDIVKFKSWWQEYYKKHCVKLPLLCRTCLLYTSRCV